MTQSEEQEEVALHIDNVLWASQIVDGAAALNHAIAHGDYESAHSEWACLMQVMVSSTGSPAKGGRHDTFYCDCSIHAHSTAHQTRVELTAFRDRWIRNTKKEDDIHDE